MSDDDPVIGGRWPKPKADVPGERLFEFDHGNDRWTCELRDLDPWGGEVQFLKNGELSHRFLWPTKDLALAWATQERLSIEGAARHE